MTASRPLLMMLVLLAGSVANASGEETLMVAVASNFTVAAERLGERFMAETDYVVRFSASSTGKLYAQIINGAPFDLFLAADRRRPRLLEESGVAIAGTRFTYAVGTLVVWSRDPALAGVDCREALGDLSRGHIAIANPELAPYGRAARQFLEREGLWARLAPRLVYGENIAQALQFVATGNARLGLVARSQAVDARLPAPSCSWPVPEGFHEPIAQDAVILRRAANRPAAAAFAAYLKSDEAIAIIRHHGYEAGP